MCRALAPHCWNVYLSCAGEPLLHPQFAAALQVTDRALAGCDTALVTNGWHLGEAAAQAIAASRLSTLYVSIDSVDPSLFGRLCGVGPTGLARVQEQVLALRQRIGAQAFPKIIVTSIAMRSTLSGLPAVTQWAAASRLHGHKVQLLLPGTMPDRGEEVILDRAMRNALRPAQRVAAAAGMHFDYPASATPAKLASLWSGRRLVRNRLAYCGWVLRRVAGRRRKGCRYTPYELTVSASGGVSVCPFRSEILWDIVREGPVGSAELRRRMDAVRPDAPECAQCRFAGR